jgi:NAD(P)-dependent dehydrogenase (short-subunit alcohol dehydrogenase family)
VSGVRLDGRTAIVTGASRGIGLAIAQALVDAGANVVLTARTEEAASAAAALLPEGRAVGYGAHAADADAAGACVELALHRFGSVDVLVNNAGTNPAFGPLVEQDHTRFAKTLDVNLYAPLLWTQLAWRAWMADHGGSIINMASVGGLAVSRDLGVYDVSKAALIHLTRQLALELGPAVRVNAIAPGVVRTRLSEALWKQDEDRVAGATPLGRIGEPSDVAGAVTFLASDQSSWITGTTVVVDGGQLLVGDVAEARLEGVA